MEHQLSFLAKSPSTSSKPVKKKSQKNWALFIDGASRGNPGPSGAGIYLVCGDTKVEKGIFLGKRTNNQAEYLALALGLFFLKKECKEKLSVTITSDSELLVRQMKNVYKVKDKTLQKIKMLIDFLLEEVSHTFKHVLRAHNKKADALANQGIDKKTMLPKTFEKLLSKYL